MSTVYVFLAEGFEEIEAVTPIDTLRRAGIKVQTVGVTGAVVTGSHGVSMKADLAAENFTLPEDAAMVILPGGQPGTTNLGESTLVKAALGAMAQKGGYIVAICAAPTVLHKYGMLNGKRATAFPGVQAQLTGANVTGAPVEVDGNIVTARSAGVALEYSHKLIELLLGKEKADEVVQNLYPA